MEHALHMNAGLVYDSIICTFSFNIRNIVIHKTAKLTNSYELSKRAQTEWEVQQQQQQRLQRHHYLGHENGNVKGQPAFLLSSKTEIHLQSTIQILSRMSCFGRCISLL